MITTQRNGGAAFPNELGDGMSLRDYFAGQALQGMLANKGAEVNEAMNTIDNMTADEAKQLLAEIAARFHIGEKVRTASTIMINIDNSIRRSECLSRIEAHHKEIATDEDGEECEESLLKWGESPDRYIETYKTALRPEEKKLEDKNGLINKYIIRKSNGEPVDPSAEYFVLRLDKHQKDKCHANACTKAVLVYASEIKKQFPELAKDLQQRYGTDDWHAKGEFPPVGAVCEYKLSDCHWYAVEITAVTKNGLCFVRLGTSDEKYVPSSSKFRPLQIERERLIKRAHKIVSVSGSSKETITKLADAGMLKMPEDKQ